MISIIIPYIRPNNMKILIETIKTNAGMPSSEFEILTKHDIDRVGCPKIVKELVAMSSGEAVCFLGDDTVPQPNFLINAYNAMRHFKDNWGLVGLNDLTGRQLPTHWLAHKKLLPLLDGEFFHTGYRHCFCDNELLDRCEAVGRYIYSVSSVVKHNNPMLDISIKTDSDYERIYSDEIFNKDKELYLKRRSNLWKS